MTRATSDEMTATNQTETARAIQEKALASQSCQVRLLVPKRAMRLPGIAIFDAGENPSGRYLSDLATGR